MCNSGDRAGACYLLATSFITLIHDSLTRLKSITSRLRLGSILRNMFPQNCTYTKPHGTAINNFLDWRRG